MHWWRIGARTLSVLRAQRCIPDSERVILKQGLWFSSDLENNMVFASHVNFTQVIKHVTYDPSVMRSLPETNLWLRWVNHSYRYFNQCSDELYHLMRLRESLVSKARDFIEKCKKAFLTDHPNVRKSQWCIFFWHSHVQFSECIYLNYPHSPLFHHRWMQTRYL